MSEQKSQERIQIEQRIVNYGFDPLEFANIGTKSLKKKMKELKKAHEINQLEAEVKNADARQKKREEVLILIKQSDVFVFEYLLFVFQFLVFIFQFLDPSA